MPDEVDDAIRELLEYKISALEARLSLELELRERARAIQATEYERRLSELNHAHATAVKEQERTLSRELFESYKMEIDKRLGIIERILAVSEGKASMVTILWSIAASIAVGLLVTFLKPK